MEAFGAHYHVKASDTNRPMEAWVGVWCAWNLFAGDRTYRVLV
jgi:hypothetical protein